MYYLYNNFNFQLSEHNKIKKIIQDRVGHRSFSKSPTIEHNP